MTRPAKHATSAIVVGAGHNGLICAAYLARSGLRTTVLEARDTVGGCASTVDAIGARVNICNCDHLWVRGTPIAEELGLAAHGLRYLDLDPCYVTLGWEGRPAWVQYHDAERTLDGLAETHPKQVDAYRRHLHEAMPLATLLRDVTNQVPTARAIFGAAWSNRLRGVRLLGRLARMSALDALRRWFDDDDLVRGALVVGPAVWGVDPATPGTGLAALTYALKHQIPVGRPAGGSGAFTDAVTAAFTAAGGTTRTSARVDTIVSDGSAVVRVGLVGGEQLDTDLVVVACDPRPLWTEWLREPPVAAAEIVARHRAAPAPQGYESKLDATLTRPPTYPALAAAIERDPNVRDATLLIGPTPDAMRRSHQRWTQGEFPEQPTFITNVASTRDPRLRTAEGHHVLSLEALWTPRLDPAAARSAAAHWFEQWNTLTENAGDDVVDWRVMTPSDYERDFSMPGGHAAAFTGSPLAAVLARPRELTRHRTPIGGLYLSGAATYPGAGIWGAPGRNAAHAILRDLGVEASTST